MSNSIAHIVSKFSPISLDGMDRVRLLKRTDKKYLMNIEMLSVFLEPLSDDYFVLEHVNKRILHYETQYFDTENLDLYNMHLHGKGRRYKVRRRFYSDSKIRFFELKTRTNQGKTEKTRVLTPDNDAILKTQELELLQNELPFAPELLHPTLLTGYDRITLVNKTSNERVTIDLSLHFEKGDDKAEIQNLVIVEVKQAEKALTPALEALRDLRQKPGGISKYCLGLISTLPQLSFNRFKPLLLKVDKLITPI
ncbi:MAG: polyphosphate polymerase domain-containing protein [Bacteroidia bacterium]